MEPGRFFRMSGPTAWPMVPARYSFSSLREIEACPRRWQYARAAWEDIAGLPRRANERALIGAIVHKVNEKLFREIARRGLPPLGTPAYLEGVKAAAVHETARTLVAEAEAAYREHPRDPGFRFRTGLRDIANEALRLFQGQYARALTARGGPSLGHGTDAEEHDLRALLRHRGALAEVAVRHPDLPLAGQIDLLVDDGGSTRIVDLKTGEVRPEYQDQLELYALMWWRMTGDLPVATEITHLQGRERFPVDPARLEVVEREVARRIASATQALAATPAAAQVGGGCRHCSARAFCGDYWASSVSGSSTDAAAEGAWIDVEFLVGGEPSANGVTGRGPVGLTMHVVFEDDVARRWGPFRVGERLRVLGGRAEKEAGVVRLVAATEVFRP